MALHYSRVGFRRPYQPVNVPLPGGPIHVYPDTFAPYAVARHGRRRLWGLAAVVAMTVCWMVGAHAWLEFGALSTQALEQLSLALSAGRGASAACCRPPDHRLGHRLTVGLTNPLARTVLTTGGHGHRSLPLIA